MERQLMQLAESHRFIGEKVAVNTVLLQRNNEADRTLGNDLRQVIASVGSGEQSGSHLHHRVLMAIEELAEWLEGHVEYYLTSAADAWGDRVYVLLGVAVATGVPATQIFDAVHRSNMTKINADNGKAIVAFPVAAGIADPETGMCDNRRCSRKRLSMMKCCCRPR